MYLNLGLSMTLKDFKLFRIEDVDFDSTVDAFKTSVSEKVNFLKENIELCYCGRILEGCTTLNQNGLKEGFVVNIIQKKEKEASLTTLPALESEIPDLVRVFQILATRNAYRRILQKLNKPDVLQNIISTTPGLSEDSTAIVILQHPELLAKLGDANAVKRVVEKHPTLANAARNLVAAVQNDMLTSPSTSAPSSHNLNHTVPFIVGSDDEEMEFLSTGESESRTPENTTSNEGEPPVNLITTSQVAAALANTAATAQSSSASGANPNTSSPLSITPEMMSAALERVIASTSAPTPDAGSSSSTQEIQGQQTAPQDDIVTEAKLEKLRRLGFTNDAINIQALQVVNGDLEMAVNLILSGLSEDN